MGVQADYKHIGDPAGMEALAAELLLRAESVAGIARTLQRRAEVTTFVGPAGDRLRRDIEERRKRADRVATELQGAAHALKRGAIAVREQIHDLRIAEMRAREGRE